MKIIILIVAILINFSAYSDQEDPSKFIGKIIKQSKPALKEKNNEYLEKIMEKYLDFDEIAIWISGKTIWTNAIKDEKLNFLHELKILMLKTYSKTIYYYIDSDVTFLKPKSNKNTYTQKRLQISSVMKKNNKNVNISYRLIQHQESWLIFDVIIEGISILKSFKTQYSDMIKTKGLKYTTNKIKISNT